MRKNHWLLFLLMVVFSACRQEKSEKQENSFNELEKYISSEVSEGRLKGVHGLVFYDGEIVFDRYLGLRDAELSDSMQGNEEFFIQSMTKPIISVALMILVEEGKVLLDDPIGDYLPKFSTPSVAKNSQIGIEGGSIPAKRQPTIRELLSHTGGLSHGLTSSVLDSEIFQQATGGPVKTLSDRIEVLSRLPLMYEPGTRWNYSFSTDLIAGVIEKVSGQSIDVFLEERIFSPLGMSNTGYNLNEAKATRVQVVYDFMPDIILKVAANQPSPRGNTLLAGSNGLFSTTHDYLLFARMLLGKGELNGVKIVKSETIDLMLKDATIGLQGHPSHNEVVTKAVTGLVLDTQGSFGLEPGYGFGLGFGVLIDSIAAERPAVPNGEFFWGGSHATSFFINPKNNLIGIFMTQIGYMPHPNPYLYYHGDQMRKFTYSSVNR